MILTDGLCIIVFNEIFYQAFNSTYYSIINDLTRNMNTDKTALHIFRKRYTM